MGKQSAAITQSPGVDEFRICFDLDNSFRGDIDEWLQFASIRNVQMLELDLSDFRFCWLNEEYYTFPCGLLGLKSGRTLGKIPPALTGFKSIKTLTLKRVNVHQEVLEFFLHNCQFLECMVEHGSKKLVNLEVSGAVHALKHLEICYCTFLESFRLCDANLVSLKITALRNLVLKNVPMLVNVCLHGYHLKFGTIVRDVIPGLFCCVSKLGVLALSLSRCYAVELRKHNSILLMVRIRTLELLKEPHLNPFLCNFVYMPSGLETAIYVLLLFSGLSLFEKFVGVGKSHSPCPECLPMA